MRPCFELISLLAEATFQDSDRPLLSPSDNQAIAQPFCFSNPLPPYLQKILTDALLKRLSDPGAVISREGADSRSTVSIFSADSLSWRRLRLVDASTIVMESCISCLIDLHSSDDPEIYQVPPSLLFATLH